MPGRKTKRNKQKKSGLQQASHQRNVSSETGETKAASAFDEKRKEGYKLFEACNYEELFLHYHLLLKQHKADMTLADTMLYDSMLYILQHEQFEGFTRSQDDLSRAEWRAKVFFRSDDIPEGIASHLWTDYVSNKQVAQVSDELKTVLGLFAVTHWVFFHCDPSSFSDTQYLHKFTDVEVKDATALLEFVISTPDFPLKRFASYIKSILHGLEVTYASSEDSSYQCDIVEAKEARRKALCDASEQ